MIEYIIAATAAAAFAKFSHWSKQAELAEAERQARLRELAPPKPEKPVKPKSRKQLVSDLETLMNEELEFAKLIRDPIAREAAEISAHARFQERLRKVMEQNQWTS